MTQDTSVTTWFCLPHLRVLEPLPPRPFAVMCGYRVSARDRLVNISGHLMVGLSGRVDTRNSYLSSGRELAPHAPEFTILQQRRSRTAPEKRERDPTPARSVSNTYPVPGLRPPLWPGGQNIVHEIRGVFELLNSHEFKIQLFCHFLSPRSATVGPGVRQG